MMVIASLVIVASVGVIVGALCALVYGMDE